MKTENYLVNSDSEEKGSYICLDPRISQTQYNCNQYATSLTKQNKTARINKFSYSVLIDLKQKQIQTRTRKNIVDVWKNKKSNFCQVKQAKNNKKTPFRNRKDLQRQAIEQKIKQLRKKKDLAQILLGNVKKWLIIKEIPTIDKQQIKIRSQNSMQQIIQKGKSLGMNTFNERSEIKKMKLRTQLQKDKININLKKSKKQKICKKLQSSHYEFSKIADQLSKLRIQTNTAHSSVFIPNKNCKRSRNLVYSKSSLGRQRQSSLNISEIKNFSASPESGSTHEVQAIKKYLRESALRCKKIDIKDKINPVRPQSAIFLQKIAKNKILRAKQTVRAGNVARQITGWQDLADSFDRQIHF